MMRRVVRHRTQDSAAAEGVVFGDREGSVITPAVTLSMPFARSWGPMDALVEQHTAQFVVGMLAIRRFSVAAMRSACGGVLRDDWLGGGPLVAGTSHPGAAAFLARHAVTWVDAANGIRGIDKLVVKRLPHRGRAGGDADRDDGSEYQGFHRKYHLGFLREQLVRRTEQIHQGHRDDKQREHGKTGAAKPKHDFSQRLHLGLPP
jgi:hypothetical protein